jgi:hypothetical protein
VKRVRDRIVPAVALPQQRGGLAVVAEEVHVEFGGPVRVTLTRLLANQ